MKKISHPLSLANWPIWLILGILWLVTRLPFSWQIRLGKCFGKILYISSKKLRHISRINIQLCFPNLNQNEQTLLIKRNFASVGIGIVETAMAWWMEEHRLPKQIQISGIEHFEEALARGKGVILLSPHATCLEMLGRLLGPRYHFAVMYRPHKKPLLSAMQKHFRQKYQVQQIARHEMRKLLRALHANIAIWYAYDVDGGEKRSVFAPFFNVPTASLTAVSRVATLSGAAIVPIHFYRLENDSGYQINFLPILDDFPSNNVTQDATRLNAILEKSIRKRPEQYIWQYKRFKTRPPGQARFY